MMKVSGSQRQRSMFILFDKANMPTTNIIFEMPRHLNGSNEKMDISFNTGFDPFHNNMFFCGRFCSWQV